MQHLNTLEYPRYFTLLYWNVYLYQGMICLQTLAWEVSESDRTIGCQWKQKRRKMVEWPNERSLRVMSLKEICYFQCIDLPAWAIPFTPGNGSETIIFEEKYCGNESSLPSSAFCGHDAVMKTIVSAKPSDLVSLIKHLKNCCINFFFYSITLSKQNPEA